MTGEGAFVYVITGCSQHYGREPLAVLTNASEAAQYAYRVRCADHGCGSAPLISKLRLDYWYEPRPRR